jgi:nucleoid DNA-binding protein
MRTKRVSPNVRRADFIRMVYADLSTESSLRMYEIDEIFDLFCQSIMGGLLEGKKIEIRHFGVFYPFSARYKTKRFKASAFFIAKVNRIKNMYAEYLNRDIDYI